MELKAYQRWSQNYQQSGRELLELPKKVKGRKPLNELVQYHRKMKRRSMQMTDFNQHQKWAMNSIVCENAKGAAYIDPYKQLTLDCADETPRMQQDLTS